MDNYIDISVEDLVSGMVIARDIKDRRGRLLIRANKRITQTLLKRIKKFNIPSACIYLNTCDGRFNNIKINNERYIENNAGAQNYKIEISRNINDLNIYNTFYIQLGNLISKCAREILKPDIDLAVIKKMILKAVCDKSILNLLMRLRVKDQYLLNHSVEVAVLCTVIGLEFEMDDAKIKNLILAAFLHDMGMVEIDNRVLFKTDPLTMDEIRLLRSHASKSVMLLSEYSNIDKEVLVIIFQHHERFNGSGYPKGLTESIINNSAKILCACDVYSAISHQRSYRDRFTPQEKIEFFFASGNYYFNYKIVRMLIDKISIYYKGQWVKLNTGHVGIISGVDGNFPARPYVKLIYDEKGNLITRSKEIFLGSMEYTTVFIEEII